MVVPSFVAKIARAKKHIIDLEAEVRRYAGGHPYTVRKSVEGKKKRNVYRLAFTADPANTDIPIIAADVIYNLRSSLDHLMCCLVPRNKRSGAMFPIYFQGIWEAPIPGENLQRGKDRERWTSDTKSLPAPAVAILKSLQPPDTGRENGEVHLVQLVNRLSNRDRHEKLPVVAAGLRSIRAEITTADGTVLTARTGLADVGQNNTCITEIPDDAVDVKIQGIPVVGIRIRETQACITIPDDLSLAAEHIEKRIFPALTPFIRQ